MKILIRQAKIVDDSSPFNGVIKDILIVDGIIQKIEDKIIDAEASEFTKNNLHVSIGWMDCLADFSEPGNEYRECISTGVAAAAAGGFTQVMIGPNNKPVVSDRSQVDFIVKGSENLAVAVLPIASITKNAQGKELTEMYDLNKGSVKAFSDGTNPVQDPAVLLKAFQYINAIEATIIQIPINKQLQNNGLVHEGIHSTRLGLPGIPAMAEELIIARDLELAAYTKSKLHISGVSTKKGIDLIQKAKESGTRVSFSITAYHLHFTDEDLSTYDTNLKTNPPLRSSKDKNALIFALQNGQVDSLATHHFPRHSDEKNCEFEYAEFGMSGLETAFAAWNSVDVPLNKLITLLTVAPRSIFGIPIPELKINKPACITLFDPDQTQIVNASMLQSKSKNNAFLNKSLKGKVYGIINNGQFIQTN